MDWRPETLPFRGTCKLLDSYIAMGEKKTCLLKYDWDQIPCHHGRWELGVLNKCLHNEWMTSLKALQVLQPSNENSTTFHKLYYVQRQRADSPHLEKCLSLLESRNSSLYLTLCPSTGFSSLNKNLKFLPWPSSPRRPGPHSLWPHLLTRSPSFIPLSHNVLLVFLLVPASGRLPLLFLLPECSALGSPPGFISHFLLVSAHMSPL